MPGKPRTCCCLCGSKPKDQDVGLFRFPVDNRLSKKWANYTTLPKLMSRDPSRLRNFRICSRHFKPNDVKQFKTKHSLKRGAIPCIPFDRNYVSCEQHTLYEVSLSQAIDEKYVYDDDGHCRQFRGEPTCVVNLDDSLHESPVEFSEITRTVTPTEMNQHVYVIDTLDKSLSGSEKMDGEDSCDVSIIINPDVEVAVDKAQNGCNQSSEEVMEESNMPQNVSHTQYAGVENVVQINRTVSLNMEVNDDHRTVVETVPRIDESEINFSALLASAINGEVACGDAEINDAGTASEVALHIKDNGELATFVFGTEQADDNDIVDEVRFHVADSASEKIEVSLNEKENEKSLDMQNGSHLPSTTTSFLETPKVRRKRKKMEWKPIIGPTPIACVPVSHLTLPEYQLPFDNGWYREIVHRSPALESQKNQKVIDVYYRSPHGKKLRSMREVGEYLLKTNETLLTLMNFSFSRRRVSVSQMEVERQSYVKTKVVKEPTNESAVKKRQYTKKKEKLSSFLGNNNKGTTINGDVVIRSCSENCPGLKGIFPNLHCNVCLSLFHSTCVGLGYDYDGIENFICGECIRSGPSTVNDAVAQLPQDFSSSADQGIPTSHNDISDVNTSYIIPRDEGVAGVSSTDPTTFMSHCANISIIPVQHETIETSQYHNELLVLPAMSIIPLNNGSSNVLPQSPDLSSPGRMNGQSPDMVHTNVHLSVPFSSSQPNVKKLTSQMKHTPRRLQAADGNLTMQKNLKTYSRKIGNVAQNKELELVPTMQDRAAVARMMPNPGVSFISNLNGGFKALLKIFQYLSLPELLRASEVCSIWREMAYHPSVWKSLSLADIMINDWSAFVKFVKKIRIQKLDMRKMVVCHDRNMMNHGMLALLSELKDLEELDLCEVPSYIVHAVVNQLPNLKHLTAEWITETQKENMYCKLDVKKFSRMSNLETLRIRSVCGLTLPSYAVNCGLASVGSLSKLTCLSLTSLQNVPPIELYFLNDLKNLKTFEFGDCVDWTVEVYDSVSRMVNLVTLRLEFGGVNSSKGIQIILSTLRNLTKLELIVFQIPLNFGGLLAGLNRLVHLTVWPDLKTNAHHNDYSLLSATKYIPHVRIFIWGFVLSFLEDKWRKNFKRIDHKTPCLPLLNYNTSMRNPTEIYISPHQLMNNLRTELPFAKVQVVMIPNTLYSTIVYMPK